MNPNEISFLVIAIAFFLLVVFLIRFLLKTEKTLAKLEKTLENVDALSVDSAQKMKSLQPIFNSIASVGKGLEIKAGQFKKEMIIDCLKEQLGQTSREKEICMDLLDCALIGVDIWKKLKK